VVVEDGDVEEFGEPPFKPVGPVELTFHPIVV